MNHSPTIRTAPRAIIRRGDLFLVARYRDAAGDWFTFPGGGQQHGEDLHEALTREIVEEVGVTPRIGAIRFVRECIQARNGSTLLPPNFHQLEVYFECTIEGEPPSVGTTPDPNQIAVEWRTIEELRKERFFPRPMLDLLSETAVRYLGAC